MSALAHGWHGNADRRLLFGLALPAVPGAALAGVLEQAEPRVVAVRVIGGLPAAPVSAWRVRHAPSRAMMLVVGSVVIVLATYNLLKSLGSP